MYIFGGKFERQTWRFVYYSLIITANLAMQMNAACQLVQIKAKMYIFTKRGQPNIAFEIRKEIMLIFSIYNSIKSDLCIPSERANDLKIRIS